MKTDPKIFIGCYVKRFYIPAKRENMYEILDARGDCDTGDFLYDDGTWRDIEDSTVITNDENLCQRHDGEFPWCLYVGHEEYTGDNPCIK